MRVRSAKLLAAATCLLLARYRQVASMSPTLSSSATPPANSDMTGCDLWFSLASTSNRINDHHHHDTNNDLDNDNKTLAYFCECRDSMASEQLESIPNRVDDHQLAYVAVGQLDCDANGYQASKMLESFEMFLRQATASQFGFRVDYLTIRMNTDAAAAITTPSAGPQLLKRLQVNQLAVSLAHLQQLESSLSLVQLDQLQSLSLSVESRHESSLSSRPPESNTRQPDIAMLNNLTALKRLEISLDDGNLRQESSSLILNLSKQSHQLKWLSVSSRSRPVEFEIGPIGTHDTSSALTSLAQLEHLSLEWNQLEQFHLFAHFPGGHSDLFTLNLANNKLKSLRDDLFCCESQLRTKSVEFSSLSQLDLSSNKLEAVDQQEAQTMRTKMPNLANLYLQHNKIKHLHLSALLGPIAPQHGKLDQVDHSLQSDRALVSQLEFIDLSHNQLSSLLTIQHKGGLRTRLRAINLAHNFLRWPISLFSPRLMQILDVNSIGELVTLDRSYELSEFGVASSLCDYLSGSATNNSSPARTTEAQDGDSTLVELLLGHNKLERLEQRHFQSKSCSSLEIFRLNDNQISVIEQEAFKYMTNLQELDLSRNNLIELPSELFVGLRELRLLNLAHNSLAGRLDLVGAFGRANSQPEHLHELRLAHNQIEQLELWSHLEPNGTSGPRLEILDLTHNQLTFSSENSLKSLLMLMDSNQLAEMRLAANKMSAFDWLQIFELFGRQTNNKKPEINLRSSGQDRARFKSRKKSLKVDLEDGATSISKTKRNKATKADRKRSAREIPISKLLVVNQPDEDDLTIGSALVLSNNRLGSFGHRSTKRVEVFPNNSSQCSHLFMESLQTLLLDNNSIREITSSTFRCLDKLEVLDLQANQLRILDELAFSHLGQLRRLSLANNFLIRLAPRHFEANHNLIKLDLSRNQLTSFEWPRAERSSNSTRSSLEWLDLSGNQALRMNSVQMWPLLLGLEDSPTDDSINSNGLRQLDLSGVMSVWSSRSHQFSKTADELSLEELDLGGINQLDWNFLEHVLSRAARLKRLRVSIKPTEDQDQLSLMEDTTRLFVRLISGQLDSLTELALSNGQLSNQILSKAIESSTRFARQERNNNQMKLLKLSTLDISQNALLKWPFEVGESGQLEFIEAATLVELNLGQNRLGDQLIGPSSTANETFRCYGLINLEKLNLSSNSLTGLLAYNMHEEKQLKLVQLMPRLRALDLAHNKLGWLPAGFFAGLNHFERLDLSHNQLVWGRAHLSVPLMSLSSFRALDLSFNVLLLDGFETRKSSSSGAPLEGQKLESDHDLIVRRERVSGAISCSSLETLFEQPIDQLRQENHEEASSNSQEQSVEVKCAAQLAGIQTLNFDGCCRGSFGAKLENSEQASGELINSSARASVSFAQNELSSFEAATNLLGALIGDSNMAVIHLDVSRNNLSDFNAESLCHRSQPLLRSLELRDQSGLTEFDLGNLRHCRQLVYLDLSHNRISSIKVDTSAQIGSELLALDLAHNHLSHLLWLASFVEANPNLRQLNLRSNRLKEASSIELILGSIKWSQPSLKVFIDFQAKGSRSRFAARHRLELTQDDSGLRIQPGNMRDLTKVTDSKLVIDLNPVEVNDSDRRLAYEVDVSTPQQFLFCSMKRQLTHRLCLNSTTSRTEVTLFDSCISFRPPRGPTCLTKLEVGNKPNRSKHLDSASSSSSHFMAETQNTAETIKTDPDQSDWLLRLIEMIRKNWIKMKQFDLSAQLARVSHIKHDSVLFYVASGDRESGPLPVYTLSLIKFGLATAAFCVVLLAIAMFVLLNSSPSNVKVGLSSKVADSGGESGAKEDATPSYSSPGSTSTSQSRGRHRLKPAAGSKSTNHSSDGSAFLDDSSATMTTTTTAGGQTGPNTTHSSRPPIRAFPLEPANKPASSYGHHNEQLTTNPNTIQRMAGSIRSQQQLYCSTPSSSLAPSSIETGETMQAVDSLQGSIGGSTLCYQSPQIGRESSAAASQLTVPVHSVDQYQMQHSIYGQLEARPVATVMRMVKSSTFNNANALNYAAAPDKSIGHDPGQLQSQTISRDMRGAFMEESALTINDNNHNNLMLQPHSISLMSVAGNESNNFSTYLNREPADLHELDPATLSLLSLNSRLSSKVSRERLTDASKGLCHYHSKFLQDSNGQQQAGYTILNQTLLEQEDETNYVNESSNQSQPFGLRDRLEYPAAPPPNP